MAKSKKSAQTEESKSKSVTVERRKASDRRSSEDRRKQDIPVAVERRQGERRAKVQRRRQIDPTTCERDYSEDEVEFMRALDDYKRRSGRMFPTCSELLEVLRGLGYAKQSAVAGQDVLQTLMPAEPGDGLASLMPTEPQGE